MKRYREYTSLPGFSIDEVSAQSFVREMLEWNLPTVVFESVGSPGLYVNWLRPSVFAAGLWTDQANTALRKNYATVGVQADTHFSILHWYDMTLSGVSSGLPERSARRRRVDDIAEDHVMISVGSDVG